MVSLLVVEQDLAGRTPLAHQLRMRGHAVAVESAALAGLQAAIDQRHDLVILDLDRPEIDGLDLLRTLRQVSPVPIIVITTGDQDTLAVAALDAGADDFILKPCGADQLDARIRAALRRAMRDPRRTPQAGPAPAQSGLRLLVVGELAIEPDARIATLDGHVLDLARKEFDLLLVLAQRHGDVVSKRELMAEVWRQPSGGAERTLEVHLSWLRRKLGETAATPRYLHVIRGIGVKLQAPPPQH